MKIKRTFLLLIVTGFAVSAFTVLLPGWNIDPNYSIKFSANRAEGTFSGLKGTILFDPDNLSAAKIDVVVDANTIKTGNTTKDSHARGKSWLHTTRYPTIQFTSKTFTKLNSTWQVTGTLTLRGIKKEVSIPFTFRERDNQAIFEGRFTINRKDYGINGNMMGFMVGNDIGVILVIPVTK